MKQVRRLRHMRWITSAPAVLLLLVFCGGTALAGPLTITGNRTETTSANYQGGSWTAGNLTLNSGVVTTLDGPLSNVFTNSLADSAYCYSGGGGARFVNNGTVDMTSTHYLALRFQDADGFHIENNGVWDFSGNGGKLYSTTPATLFLNASGGIVKATGGGVTGFSIQSGAGGRFQNLGGTVIATNGTTLHILWGGPHAATGGTWDSTGGTILIGSSWSNLTCMAVGNPVKLGSDIRPAADLSILNVSGEGFEWNANLIYCDNRTWKNDGTVTVPVANREILSSAGGDPDVFWNAGTFILDYASGNFLLGEDTTFTNSGTFVIAAGSSPLIYERTGSKFYNSGTLRKEGAGTATFGQTGSFENHGGDVVADTGSISIAPSGGPNLSSGGTWTSANGGTIGIGGPWSGVTGTAVNSPIGLLGTLSAAAATSVVDIGGEGFQWTSGQNLSHGANILELAGTVEAVATGSSDIYGSSAGALRITGHFIVNFSAGDLNIDMQAGGTEIRNEGIFEIRSAGGNREIYARDGNCEFNNMASGVITQNVADVFNMSGGGPGTFRNEGTIVMNAGTFQLTSAKWNVSASTVDSGSLLEGTWKCDGGNVNLTGSDIDTIGANAAVILGSSGSVNKITEASLTAVHGTFGLHGGRTWTTTGALTTEAGATHFEFGLDGTGSDAKLTVGGSSTLNGVIDVVDLGGLTGGTYRVIEMAAGQTLTVGTVAAGTLTTDQDLTMSVSAVGGVGAAGYVEVEIGEAGSVAVVTVPGADGGGVADDFDIAENETTVADYVGFLNALGASELNVAGGEVKLASTLDVLCLTDAADDDACVAYDAGAPEGSRFSAPSNRLDHPMVHVSWFGAAAYCNWKSDEGGLTAVYDPTNGWAATLSADGYRLPTEAEWHKAAAWDSAAGSFDTHGTGSDVITTNDANYLNSGDDCEANAVKTCPVASYETESPYGLKDASGNVWEWCHGFYDGGSDPDQDVHAVRGGGWGNLVTDVMAASRAGNKPWHTKNSVGFRLARNGN